MKVTLFFLSGKCTAKPLKTAVLAIVLLTTDVNARLPFTVLSATGRTDCHCQQ